METKRKMEAVKKRMPGKKIRLEKNEAMKDIEIIKMMFVK